MPEAPKVPILTVGDIEDELSQLEELGRLWGRKAPGYASIHGVCAALFNPKAAEIEDSAVKDKAFVYPIEAVRPLSIEGIPALILKEGPVSLYNGELVFRSYSWSGMATPENPFQGAKECRATLGIDTTKKRLDYPDTLPLNKLVNMLKTMDQDSPLFLLLPNQTLLPLIGVCYYTEDARVIFRAWRS